VSGKISALSVDCAELLAHEQLGRLHYSVNADTRAAHVDHTSGATERITPSRIRPLRCQAHDLRRIDDACSSRVDVSFGFDAQTGN
jgi:hypothetical protein